MKNKGISEKQVLHIANLCNLTLTDAEVKKLSEMLSDTLGYIDVLNELDASEVKETFQVTGLTNVFQEDNEKVTTLSQEEALSNGKEIVKDMFATEAIF
ncbi:Asp-tRNA(Asn)/Glu-tRNA(Gln) amidotransferase subunit GatC [Patescibacteria group bacterium]